nr:AAA family ATPase [uncultured Holophaga sp.]
MRLLKLEVENLNALYGTHAIDFVADLQEAPLFLISGPTGAGKSTLLDAISLALFGVTPRLRDEGPRESRADVDPAQALSRGAARGRAVLTFRKSSPGEGSVTYRATWETWRGNRRAPRVEGSPQGPYRWLEKRDADTWTRLATDYPGEQGRARDLNEALHLALEGFSLQDFTRCMLLAQGDFAAFLRATEAERGAILERLTRTESYQQLGARAAQRLREAKAVEERASQALGNLQILDPAELAALEIELAQRKGEADEALARCTLLQAGLTWMAQGERLDEDLQGARGALEQTQEAMSGAAPDLERLRAFEELRPALAHLESTRGQRHQLEVLSREQHERSQAAQDRAKELEAIETQGKEAAARAQEAQLALEAQEPVLQQARELRQARKSAEGEAIRARQKVAEAGETLTGTTRSLEKAEGTHLAREATHALAQRQLADAPWEALTGALGALETRQSSLETERTRLAKEQAVREELSQELPEIAKLHKENSDALNTARERMETLQAEEAAALRDLDLALAGAPDPAEARRRLEHQREERLLRETSLEGLGQQLQALNQIRGQLQERETSAQAARDLATSTRTRAQEAAQTRGASALAVQDLEQQLELMRWARDLARERGRLQAGNPCPLCGSEAHPALEDTEQERKDQAVRETCTRLETQLARAREHLSEEESKASATEREALELGAKATAEEQLLGAARTQTAETESALTRAASILGVEPQPGAIEAAFAASTSARQSLETQRKHLDDQELAYHHARQAFNQAQQETQHLESQLRMTANRLQERRERLASEDRRLAEAAEALAALQETFEAELGAHGLEPGAGMEEARRRVDLYTTARIQAETAQRELEAAHHALELAGQAHQGALEAHQSAQEAASRREEALAEARKAVEACLSGADPEPIHQTLKRERDETQHRHEALRQSYQTTRDAHVAAQKALEETEGRLGRARSSLEEAENRLTDLLQPIGEEATLEARALSPEEAASLSQRRKGLEEALKRASTTLETLQKQSAGHAAQRPQGLDPTQERSALEAYLEESREAQRRASEAAGGLQAQMKAQEEARFRLAEGLESLRQAQTELSLWTRMNKLIGTNEGEAFRRFAQVLNLRDLLAKANARLEKLRPRYRLVPATGGDGAERLAFAVEDAAHAGEVRPVGTLSGGETFLVSLSLALALADYRTVRMPIETLLLDEGFGTLDPRTLADVLGTLGTLTSQGTQVGLISHVELMAEKIPARIRVEPVAPGRSRVRVETDQIPGTR